jgi:fructokinase
VKVELAAGEPHFTLAQGAAWDRIEKPPPTLLAEADVICFGTLAQRTPLSLGTLSAALDQAPTSLLRVCDLNVRLPHTTREAIDAAVSRADVIKLNHTEAEILQQIYDVGDAIEFLLHSRGVKVVALTRGEKGSELVTPTEHVFDQGPQVPQDAGDRVGAGDSYTAVLALGVARKIPLAELVRRANRYAAWVASQPGAMPPPPSFLTDVIVK